MNQGGAPIVSSGTSFSASCTYPPGTYTTGPTVSTSWGNYSLCATETETAVTGNTTFTFTYETCGVDQSWQGLGN